MEKIYEATQALPLLLVEGTGPNLPKVQHQKPSYIALLGKHSEVIITVNKVAKVNT